MPMRNDTPNSFPSAFFGIVKRKGTFPSRHYFEDFSWSRTLVEKQWKAFKAFIRTSKLADVELQEIAIWHEWKWKEKCDSHGSYFEVEAWPLSEEKVTQWRAAVALKRKMKLEGILLKRRRRKLTKKD